MSEAPHGAGEGRLVRLLRAFERAVIVALVVMMALVVGLATVELGVVLVKDLVRPPALLLEVPQLLELFGLFLLVLIGVELLESTKAYLRAGVVHVEIVVEVALIAVARKVIVLDLETYDGGTVLALAALLLALAAALHLARRRRPAGP